MGQKVLVSFQEYRTVEPIRTCEKCLYFFVCGDYSRTEYCDERLVKTIHNAHKTMKEAVNEANRRRCTTEQHVSKINICKN